ncbi:MAG: ABC-type transport system involved in multi-copper enzyme maturation permease subunit [Mariniblastus sp.]|jgi:ABC-type transport system involved in multi-copper enzyme maturation permease subunit
MGLFDVITNLKSEIPLLVGPVFSREAAVAPRRPRHYVVRAVYAVALLLLICTAWMILKGTQIIQNVGDMARFGAILFQILAPLQLALIMFLSAIRAASNVAIEKDRQTLILLLMSRLTNSELVLGKLFASLLNIGVMLLTSLPIFMLIVLFGGTSFTQVGWTFAVTAVTALAAGSLGVTIALWREKTFQTLALVAMCIVFWLGVWESVGVAGIDIFGISSATLAGATSPMRAIIAASHPTVSSSWSYSVVPYLIVSLGVASLLCGLAILRVRRWNPSRDVRSGQSAGEEAESKVDMFTGNVVIEGVGGVADSEVPAASLTGQQVVEQSEKLRSGHVDDRARTASQSSRRVWDNPVLWRETRTWAYGRKILFIRAAYWLLAACVFLAIYSMVSSGAATRVTADAGVTIPVAARPLAPFILVSIVMVNALAVTSITTERDGRALDLLMVTDISPKEFLFGKLGGVLFVVSDMIVLPLLMCGYLWFNEAMTGENLIYICVGVFVLFLFVSMLGIHCGMSYDGSRQAIGVSLGTVFFLFLGVVTVMVMMISFTGNVEAQLSPFLACIVGGAIGLYVALGWHTPSPALVLACAALPIAMFYSITSFMIGSYLSVLLVVCFTYGFATTAMMIPRLSEFLVSSGRSKTAENG